MPLEAVSSEVGDTTARRPAPLGVQLLFSFPVALAALLVALAVLTVRDRFNDPDMWWHLKTGEFIWNTHHIPTIDTFSYTSNNHPYVPHEWLAQWTIYAAYHFGGYSGMMLWLCLLTSFLLVGGYVLCALHSGNAKVAFLGAMGIWLFSTVSFAIRPQLIGYDLFLLELLIIHLGRRRNPRWFLLLPPLFAVWVNCHGSFFLGIMVALVLLACSFVRLRMGQILPDQWSASARRYLGASLFLSFVALWANPVGWRQITYPLDALFRQNLQKQYVSEWQPLTVVEIRGQMFFVLAALVLLLPALRRRGVFFSELMLLLLSGWLALHHSRLVVVFGLLVMPCLCRLLSDTWNAYDISRDRILPNALLSIAAMIVAAVAFPTGSKLTDQMKRGNPVGAVEFLKHLPMSGNMLNEYGYGGYLIWALPERKVFVDGRGDVFEWSGTLRDYFEWANIQQNPTVLLSKYRIMACILPQDSPMARVVRLLRGWQTVYSDDKAVVIVRRARANE